MTIIQTDVDIQSLNSLGLPCRAAGLCRVNSINNIKLACQDQRFIDKPRLILGGGSNVVFADDFPGLILQPDWQGIEIIDETDDTIHLSVGASVVWDNLVRWSVERKLYGLENLAAIPGWCGAAPMQNIGAYGVEFSDACQSVSYLDLETGLQHTLPAVDCQFGYRHSVFKTAMAEQWLIIAIQLKLHKQAELITHYPGVAESLEKKDIANPSPAQLADIITTIRRHKLPAPEKIGNAGSFFKNPIVSQSVAEDLLSQNPGLPHWPVVDCEHGQVKLSAAWLIDQCGWKGRREGPVGVHHNHALVLVHYGNGNGHQLLQLARQIQQDVSERFAVELQPEPKIIKQPQ